MVAKLRASIEHVIPDVLEAVIEKAKAGDMTAAKMLLERVLPPLKSMEGPGPPLPFMMVADPKERLQAIMKAVADGEVPPDMAVRLFNSANVLHDLHKRGGRLPTIDEILNR
jgi:hypothetical protein